MVFCPMAKVKTVFPGIQAERPLRQFAEGARVKRNSGRLDTVKAFSRRRPELERRDNPKVRLPFPSNPPGP